MGIKRLETIDISSKWDITTSRTTDIVANLTPLSLGLYERG